MTSNAIKIAREAAELNISLSKLSNDQTIDFESINKWQRRMAQRAKQARTELFRYNELFVQLQKEFNQPVDLKDAFGEASIIQAELNAAQARDADKLRRSLADSRARVAKLEKLMQSVHALLLQKQPANALKKIQSAKVFK